MPRFSILTVLFCHLLALSANGTELGGDDYERLKAASVEVLVNRRLHGSGCLVHRDGTVLTAAHVVPAGDAMIEILSPTLGRIRAEIQAVDPGHDLALLALPRKKGGYPFLPVARQPPANGSAAFLFGAPLFRHGLLMRGSIARTSPSFEFVDGHYIEVQYLVAATPGGSSGGPWVTAEGELFGLQSSAMIIGSAPQGVAFAAPLKAIQQLLKTRQSTAPATLGSAFEEIWEQQPAVLEIMVQGTEGLVVRVLDKSGPLAAAGVRDGDIILTANGTTLQWRDQLLKVVRSLKPADDLELTVSDPSGRSRRQVKVQLGSLARPDRATKEQP